MANLQAVIAAALAHAGPSETVISSVATGVFADAFEQARAEDTEAAKTALVGTIREALNAHRSGLEQKRAEHRRLQAAIRRTRAWMDDADMALAYGMETGNLLPLLLHLGSVSVYSARSEAGEDYLRICSVPNGWTPKASESTDD